jgi:hypothetical protein
MIGYCPLEEEPPRSQITEVRGPVVRKEPQGLEETECNFLVLGFIVGVVILAATDRV